MTSHLRVLLLTALILSVSNGSAQNYMADFLQFRSKADSIIRSLGYQQFVADNYYLSVEKSHPFSGQGVYGSRWADTVLFKSGNIYPRAWEYVYRIKGLDEVGFSILIEREPRSLEEVFYSSYNQICFVNGLPVDKKNQPRNFLPAAKIRSLTGAKRKTDLTKAVCELTWDVKKEQHTCKGIYYYKVMYALKEAGKNYVYVLQVDPSNGKILSSKKEEAAPGQTDVPFAPVKQ